jgi:hypothetical protein
MPLSSLTKELELLFELVAGEQVIWHLHQDSLRSGLKDDIHEFYLKKAHQAD